MGQVYNPWFNENGGVPDPAFFVQNMATMAAEFNSGLDRDNIAQNTIVAADIDTSGGQVFNLVGNSFVFNTEDTWAPDVDLTSWQGGTGNGSSGLGYL